MNQSGQTGIRKGTREKKRSRFHYYEEAEFNGLFAPKTHEPKPTTPINRDKAVPTSEINQIAKLFCKFINVANQRSQDIHEPQQGQLLPELPDLPKDGDSFGLINNKKAEARTRRDLANDSKNQRSRDFGQLVNKDQKEPNKETKNRTTKNNKSNNTLPPSLETDLNYHNALNEHVKNAYPNINDLSADMLRELSIPTEMLQKQPASRPKPKDEKKVIKPVKDENKPFKRQSYHIAIAYHIHIKYVKASKTQEYLDPTYSSRKLREKTQKETQRDKQRD